MEKNYKKNLLTLLFSAILVVNSFAQIPLVYDVENSGAECTKPTFPAIEDLVNYPLLPDPFAWSDGSGRVESFDDWECRRNEIKAEIEEYEIGPKPVAPSNITATYTDNTLTVVVTENDQTLTLTSTIVIPEGDGPFPVVIGMNSGTGSLPAELFEGVIKVPFMHNQVVTYSQTSDRNLEDPYYDLYPDLTYVGNYSAWAWGVSRLIDGIEIVQAELNADLAHIAVTGCSYAGKMALFSGAYDERIALTIAQESGGGGINAWRVSETIGNVEKIDNTNYSWFMQSMKTNFGGKVGLLPHDHHELMAMVLPRALLVLGNPPYEWLGDESGYVASRAVQEVYKTFEIEDRFGFSFRSGHDHCQLPTDSYPEVQAFVDKFLFEDETANTTIQVHEFSNVDYDSWIAAWKEPADPNAPSITIAITSGDDDYLAPATITVEATVTDANDDVVKVEFFNGQEKIGEDTEVPYALTWSDVSIGNYYISAEVVDAEDFKGYSNIVNAVVKGSTIEVANVGGLPTIDGAIDELWNIENVATFEATTVLVGTDLEASDVSGTAKMLWGTKHLYLLAIITDDAKQNDSPNIYEDDNVEFYFDIDNAKSTSYDANDVQYSFGWNDGTIVGSLPSGRSTTGITYTIVDNDNGYVVEAKIPWATLQGTPADGLLIGFDFMINDDDDGGGRDAKLSWNAAEDQAWQDASHFGTIKFVGDPIEETEEEEEETVNGIEDDKSPLMIYPNPVQNVLRIEGNSRDFDFRIIDLTGQLVLKGHAQDSIQIGTLIPGVYIVNIADGVNQSNLKFIKE